MLLHPNSNTAAQANERPAELLPPRLLPNQLAIKTTAVHLLPADQSSLTNIRIAKKGSMLQPTTHPPLLLLAVDFHLLLLLQARRVEEVQPLFDKEVML